MKTMKQQLQSRISLRRNVIRQEEANVMMVKRIAQFTSKRLEAIPDEDGEAAVRQMYAHIREAKHVINEIAKDQKLDKQLYSLLVEIGRF